MIQSDNIQKAKLEKLRSIENPETMGDTINMIHRLDNHRNAVVVHTRDNCIRVLNYEKNKVGSF